MIFASNNVNKVKEIESIFNFKIKSLADLETKIIINETGSSLKENAIIKAKLVYEKIGIPTLADDSGLEIEALDGFPGVLTNRFLGENATSHDRNQEILKMMKGKNNRTCYFKCAIAYYDGINLIVKEAKLKGEISTFEKINNGFGFDSIFLYKNKFLSDLTLKEKNKISPRQKALSKMLLALQEIVKH